MCVVCRIVVLGGILGRGDVRSLQIDMMEEVQAAKSTYRVGRGRDATPADYLCGFHYHYLVQSFILECVVPAVLLRFFSSINLLLTLYLARVFRCVRVFRLPIVHIPSGESRHQEEAGVAMSYEALNNRSKHCFSCSTFTSRVGFMNDGFCSPNDFRTKRHRRQSRGRFSRTSFVHTYQQ